MVRAAAATMFFGETAEALVDGRRRADRRRRGDVAGVGGPRPRARRRRRSSRPRSSTGMGDRVLSWQGGERQMTDLAHMTQLLQEAAHREHFSLPALRDWLREQREERSGATERDAPAGQRRRRGADHDGVRRPRACSSRSCTCRSRSTATCRTASWCCSTTGDQPVPARRRQRQPGLQRRVEQLGRAEDASDDSRLTYVAMTRAQSQVVAWWAPSWDEPNGGLSRLLRGRRPGEAEVPDRCAPDKISDDDAMARLREWEARAARSSRSRWCAPVPALPAERAADRPRARGTSTARSTPRGGGRRTRA